MCKQRAGRWPTRRNCNISKVQLLPEAPLTCTCKYASFTLGSFSAAAKLWRNSLLPVTQNNALKTFRQLFSVEIETCVKKHGPRHRRMNSLFQVLSSGRQSLACILHNESDQGAAQVRRASWMMQQIAGGMELHSRADAVGTSSSRSSIIINLYPHVMTIQHLLRRSLHLMTF